LPRAETSARSFLTTNTARKGLRWYYVVSAIFLLQGIGAFAIFDRLVYGEWAYKPGDKITQALNLLLIVTSLLLFSRAFFRKKIGAGAILMLALVSFLLLSAVWSIDPSTTVRRGVVYLWFVIGTIGVVGSLDGDEAMDLLGLVLALCAAASIVLLVISPSNALMPDSSGLRGIFPHKSVFGQVMAIGALVSLHTIRTSHSRRRLSKIGALILFTGLTFWSKSSTAILMIFAFCAVNGVITIFRLGNIGRIVGVFLIIFLVPAAGIVAWDQNTLLETIGKDPTLTGRTELWSYLLNDIGQRPMLGWGFRAFWSGKNPAVWEIQAVVGWVAYSAHNGLLEILLDVGIVGSALFLLLWARNVVLALQRMNTAAKELAISSLLVCGGVLLNGITEPVLTDPGVLTSAFFTMGLMCERAARRRRYPTTLRVTPRVPRANPQQMNFTTR
jgi:exopolysaccharide production protein ExoQ